MPQKESMVIKTLWRGAESRPCHSDKEVEAATAEGFGPYNPAEHQYPRMLYQGADSIKVNSSGEEVQFVKEGWGRTPSKEFGKTTPVAAQSAPPVVDERVSGLAARLTLAEANIAALESKFAALEAPPAPKDEKKKG